MCLGIPMQVVEVDGVFAWCEGRGRRERLNILWLGETSPGDWVYAILGQARNKLTLQQVTEINLALDGLAAAMQGETNLDAYFPEVTKLR
ncbi:MAG TPA: HypC/HybG/HupF family hydrogenase formation chaperone [Gallionella sp.]